MLTARQQEILTFIRTTCLQTGRAPTVREIGAEFGISSPNGVHCHLKALRKKGFVRDSDGKTRGAVLVNLTCPHCGKGLSSLQTVEAACTEVTP